MKKLYALTFTVMLAAGIAGAAMAQEYSGGLTAAPANFVGDFSGDTGQIETGGNYVPSSGQKYMDVYGSSNKFPAVGLIDFTGIGQPTVTDGFPNYDSVVVNTVDPDITLDLFDSDYSSSKAGTLDFYLSESNAALSSSSLTYDTTTPNGVGSGFGTVFLLGTGSYTPSPINPTDDTYNLTLPNQEAQNYFIQQLNNGGNIRILVAGDSSTSGVVGGFYGSTSGDAPVLSFTAGVAAVPEAGIPALLMLGLLGIAGLGIARRRAA